MKRLRNCIAALLLSIFLLPSFASAQATRTWVSGVGDDANPCSRTAPCKTFAGAISKTATSGEISVLDPGGFGSVTITKSITLNGDATLGGILAASSINGITINAAATDTVIIRNISIQSPGLSSSGLNGIRFVAGGHLVVENTTIIGFTTADSAGIRVDRSTAGNVSIRNVSISNSTTGVKVKTTVGKVNLSATELSVQGSVNAFVAEASALVTIRDSTFTNNSGFGIVSQGGSFVSVVNSHLSGNGVAVQADLDSKIRLARNTFFDNATIFGCGQGKLFTSNDNVRAGGQKGCVPEVSLPIN